MPNQAQIATDLPSSFISAEHLARRAEAFDPNAAADTARGVAYRIQYRFMPVGRRSDTSIWLEDHGRGGRGRTASLRAHAAFCASSMTGIGRSSGFSIAATTTN